MTGNWQLFPRVSDGERILGQTYWRHVAVTMTTTFCLSYPSSCICLVLAILPLGGLDSHGFIWFVCFNLRFLPYLNLKTQHVMTNRKKQYFEKYVVDVFPLIKAPTAATNGPVTHQSSKRTLCLVS